MSFIPDGRNPGRVADALEEAFVHPQLSRKPPPPMP